MQDALHSGDEFGLGDMLKHIPGSDRFERLQEVFGILVHSYENHASCRALLLDGTARSQAILPRHAHVDQGEIGLQAVAERQRLAAISRLTNQLHSALAGEHRTQASSPKLMVISDHQPCRFTLSPE